MKEEVRHHNQAWDWNAIARRHVDRHPRVGYLPFYNVTAQLWDLHEEIACGLENSLPNCCDCTHVRTRTLGGTQPAARPWLLCSVTLRCLGGCCLAWLWRSREVLQLLCSAAELLGAFPAALE